MSRRVLITLILLPLLFASGAAVFYFQLRKNALPEFYKVDQFLRQIPPSGDRVLAKTEESEFDINTSPSWLQRIGIHRLRTLPRNYYLFADPSLGDVVGVMVTRDFQRITGVMVLGKPAKVEGFKRVLLEKFPQLRRVLKEVP